MKRRRDHLYERNNGIFCFRYKDSQENVWKEKSTGTTDLKEARKFKKNWDRRNEDGTVPNDKAEWDGRTSLHSLG
jgi:hypothetical protein